MESGITYMYILSQQCRAELVGRYIVYTMQSNSIHSSRVTFLRMPTRLESIVTDYFVWHFSVSVESFLLEVWDMFVAPLEPRKV